MCVKTEAAWRKERGKAFVTGLIGKGIKLRKEERKGSRTESWGGEGEEEDQCRFVALSIRNCYGARRL